HTAKFLPRPGWRPSVLILKFLFQLLCGWREQKRPAEARMLSADMVQRVWVGTAGLDTRIKQSGNRAPTMAKIGSTFAHLLICGSSCKTTLSNELWISRWPL